ncbi:MAG TPA: hypothetical protein VFE07_14995 [Marmoricola sp.]|jgi:hypothetical protein|nr:hypothetical protein [Marmoricola sp.]
MDPARGRLLRLAAGGVAVAFVVSACTGQPSSTSAWQSSSDRTLGSVISGLGTARVVVREESQHDLPHTYAVVAVTDVIDTSSKEVSSFIVGQPPDRLHRAHAAVTRALQDGIALLVDVRTALASPGLSGPDAQRLTKELDAMRDRLDTLDSQVTKSPESVGAS